MQTYLKVLPREDGPFENLSEQEIQHGMPLFLLNAVKAIEENEFVKKNAKRFADLTRREKEILKLVAKGQTSREIGDRLFISKHTVDTHRRNIIEKLGLDCMSSWKKYAYAFGL